MIATRLSAVQGRRESGTYVFIYTNGPDNCKVAKIIDVEAGPVTTEVPTHAQKD